MSIRLHRLHDKQCPKHQIVVGISNTHGQNIEKKPETSKQGIQHNQEIAPQMSNGINDNIPQIRLERSMGIPMNIPSIALPSAGIKAHGQQNQGIAPNTTAHTSKNSHWHTPNAKIFTKESHPKQLQIHPSHKGGHIEVLRQYPRFAGIIEPTIMHRNDSIQHVHGSRKSPCIPIPKGAKHPVNHDGIAQHKPEHTAPIPIPRSPTIPKKKLKIALKTPASIPTPHPNIEKAKQIEIGDHKKHNVPQNNGGQKRKGKLMGIRQQAPRETNDSININPIEGRQIQLHPTPQNIAPIPKQHTPRIAGMIPIIPPITQATATGARRPIRPPIIKPNIAPIMPTTIAINAPADMMTVAAGSSRIIPSPSVTTIMSIAIGPHMKIVATANRISTMAVRPAPITNPTIAPAIAPSNPKTIPAIAPITDIPAPNKSAPPPITIEQVVDRHPTKILGIKKQSEPTNPQIPKRNPSSISIIN
jgi:hypothetical protein